ncbi:MAG: sigma-70 family RNA polymerase sigma factor [Acidobacteria bacterium]|nr:sigma-70 family RNA polymerase sigma factor [Acidobacteriota bacterium]
MELAVREENQTTTVPDGIERMFDECHGLVFRTAYRITGNAADAEDVLQAVFLRLLRRDRSAEPLENAESYLRRAAVNASLDVVRSRRDSATVPLAESPPGPAGDQRDLRDGLRRALASLSPRSAELFALRFFEGYSNPEIARLLGMSQVHVAVLLHRTRKQLQKEIKSYLGVVS